MRRMLRILFWLGLGLSTILFVGTVVLWVRSLGHREVWYFNLFEPRPDWTAPDLAGAGARRWWFAEAVHGRLWLGSGTEAPEREFKPQTPFRREPISADKANEHFDSAFPPGERGWWGGTERPWRFAGAGFRQWAGPVDPEIGRPNHESFELALPFWMLAVVFGLWPTLFTVWRLLRKKRHSPNLCPQCGYDLRATPDRCPECGQAVDAGRGLGENG